MTEKRQQPLPPSSCSLSRSLWSRPLLSRCALALFLLASPAVTDAARGEEVVVTITTLAPVDGVFLTPLWAAFHDGGFDSYDLGAAVSTGLERLAEDGNTSPLSNEFAATQVMGEQATLSFEGGPLVAGATVQRTFELDPDQHRYFSYASMVIPSNDAFVGNDDPLAHRVFDPEGRFTPVTFVIRGSDVKDAGTEVNDELPESTAALGQSSPDTGVDEGGVVTDHPGFIEDGRILTARPTGDFERPGYQIARVTLRRARNVTVTFDGDGSQEVPPVTTDATAVCAAKLYVGSDRLQVRCEHDVENVAAAHVHLGDPGMNGPVLLPFADPTSPLNEIFDVDQSLIDQFLAGELYVNVHSSDFPGGEVRAQIDGCFEGPTSLCLQSRRFEVGATFTTNEGTGTANAVPATADSGQFTFFDPANVELDVKVLDGCAINGNYWVFAAGLTDVGVQLTVTDTANGDTINYESPLGTPFVTITDTAAFPCS